MSRKCPENVKKHVQQILENLGKGRPDITTHTWLPKIKCSSKNVRFGLKPLIMVSLWPEKFSQLKFSDEPKNQQNQWCCDNSEYLLLNTQY